MALPVQFPEQNYVFGRPQGMTQEECGSRPCYRGTEDVTNYPIVISAWLLSPEELEEVKKTGLVWLRVYSPGMYPVSISGQRPWESTSDNNG
jgi:hypothetical protein